MTHLQTLSATIRIIISIPFAILSFLGYSVFISCFYVFFFVTGGHKEAKEEFKKMLDAINSIYKFINDAK